jgi:hypothetical protein
MAKYGGSNVGFLLVGGFNLVGYATEVSPVCRESVFEDSHTLGDAWAEHLAVGLRKGYFEQKGFFDDESGGINEAISGNTGTSRVLTVGHEGNTIGKKFVGLAGAFGSTYERVVSRGTLHKANVKYTVSGEVEDGVILHALTAETATGDTEGANSQDNLASSANGGAGYLEVSAISGAGATLDARVRHSADDITYATLITFTQVALADTRAAQRVTVAGTVNRHTASAWTIAGATPSVTFMVGFVRNP